MSFQQGLSGLNAAGKNLDAIGNNVANAATVGYKGSSTVFSDVFAGAAFGVANNAIGIGTQVTDVAQDFGQGTLSISTNPLDIAINGAGLFRMNTSGTISYSRNGQFQLDKNGFIVNARGSRLTGYAVNSAGSIVPSAPVDLQISSADIAPVPTTTANIVMNLDSSSAVLPALPAFDQTNTATFSSATSLTVYDSLGSSHSVALYFRKTAAGVYATYSSLDGATATSRGNLTFNSSGALTAPTSLADSLVLTNGATTPQAVTYNFASSTQFGSPFAVSSLAQDGNASGRLTGFTVGQDGTILGRYSNGLTRAQGQVVLANFTNLQGLQPLGNSSWAETADSGPPLVGAPSTGSLGIMQSGALEQSNVDMTAELVSMITAQRVYQANAQSIKTQDQVLQTLVNLR
ncbi:MAG: flagellar hook protein FlgE [Burkholderiaceae bacterium]|nr:MAG: flagellar hook protein FlgE [Burkholderiaceae bacterium]